MNGKRDDQRGYAKNKADIGNVGADRVADGQSRVAVDGCNAGDQDLRGRGAKAANGQADHHWRNAQVVGQCGRAADKAVGGPDQHRESGKNGKNVWQHQKNIY